MTSGALSPGTKLGGSRLVAIPGVVLGAALVLASLPAHADDSALERARKLAREARTLVEGGDPGAACSRWTEALAAFPEDARGPALLEKAGVARDLARIQLELHRREDFKKTVRAYFALVVRSKDASEEGAALELLEDGARRGASLSLERLEELEGVARDAGFRRGTAQALHDQGIVAENASSHLRALELYEEALAERKATGDLRGVAWTENNIAHTLVSAGRPVEAAAHLGKGLAAVGRLETPHADVEAVLVGNLGHAIDSLVVADSTPEPIGEVPPQRAQRAAPKRRDTEKVAAFVLAVGRAIPSDAKLAFTSRETLLAWGHRCELDAGGPAMPVIGADAAATMMKDLADRKTLPASLRSELASLRAEVLARSSGIDRAREAASKDLELARAQAGRTGSSRLSVRVLESALRVDLRGRAAKAARETWEAFVQATKKSGWRSERERFAREAAELAREAGQEPFALALEEAAKAASTEPRTRAVAGSAQKPLGRGTAGAPGDAAWTFSLEGNVLVLRDERAKSDRELARGQALRHVATERAIWTIFGDGVALEELQESGLPKAPTAAPEHELEPWRLLWTLAPGEKVSLTEGGWWVFEGAPQ